MQLLNGTGLAAAAQRQHRLIESKFTAPRVALRVMALPRLEARFGQALARRLTSINTPPGFGKTTAMISLRARAKAEGMATAWLGLDSGDNDPMHFLRYVSTALLGASGEPGAARANASLGLPLESALNRLCADLDAAGGPLALFLDDFHVIDNPVVHRMLDWLLERCPPSLVFVVASRLQLPLALGKLRLAGAISEIGTGELSFSAGESADFVRASCARELSAGQVRLLHERTEGWVAGLQLASSALAEADDVDRFVRQFSGSDRDITDYLGEIVIRQLPDKLRAFLMRSALFDRFSVAFCHEVLEQDDAFALMEMARVQNLFLMPLDRQGQWFRYHQLFSQLLKQRFLLSHPVEVKRLYRAASAWFSREGFDREAIAYALAAQDVDTAAALIARYAAYVIGVRGEHTTLLNWVAALPPACVERQPRLRLAWIWSLVMSNRYREAEAEFVRIESSAQAPAADPGQAQWERKIHMMRCSFLGLTGRPQRAALSAARWLARWGQRGDSMDVATVLTTSAYCACLAHDYQGAGAAAANARTIFARHGSMTGIAYVETIHALILFEQGRILQAEAVIAAAYAQITEKLGEHSAGASSLAMMRAYLCYEQDKIDEAEQILDSIFALVDQHTFAESAVAAYLTRARIFWLRGAHGDADACLATGVAAAERLGLEAMAITLHAARAQLFLQAGRVDDARRIAATARAYTLQLHESDSVDVHQPATHELGDRLMQIRLDLTGPEPGPAQARLNDLVAEARRDGRQAWLVKLLCVKAALCVQRGQQREALRAVDEALAIGANGMRRTLLDEGPLVVALLDEISARRSGQAAPAAPAAQAGAPGADMLTEREVQILKLVDKGMKNRDVAAQLFVSDETVKWHLRNIYSKLNVSNRTGAVAHARSLGLLGSGAGI